MTQRLEPFFRTSLNRQTGLWFIKLQVLPLAHTVSPADYLILSKVHRYLCECKQVNMAINPKATYAFERWTQRDAMLAFTAKHELNRAYVLVGFIERLLKKSEFYLIPANDLENFENRWPKKSITRSEAASEWVQYRVRLTEKMLALEDTFV